MADQTKISGMLEHLINDEQEKAEELFHEYIVEKSREIYEGLIETELDEASDEDEEDDQTDEDIEENFEEFEVVEADDETDDLVADVEDDEGEEMGDDEGEEMGDDEGEELSDEEQTDRILDLEDQLSALEAEFAKMKEEEAGEPYHKEMNDDFELETVREYVEKVATPKGGDNGANAKSVVAGKNDMGGTAANIVAGGAEEKGGKAAAPKEDNGGNINVPGGKAGDAFKKNSAGHGAEKKGAAEQADNTSSLFRK